MAASTPMPFGLWHGDPDLALTSHLDRGSIGERAMGVDVKLHSPLSDSMFLICSLPPCRTERVSLDVAIGRAGFCSASVIPGPGGRRPSAGFAASLARSERRKSGCPSGRRQTASPSRTIQSTGIRRMASTIIGNWFADQRLATDVGQNAQIVRARAATQKATIRIAPLGSSGVRLGLCLLANSARSEAGSS